MVTPIQTMYQGCLFRSRLESRWAVFFDTLGMRWRYEPEGFHLPSGRMYLPDFRVDGVGYVEIKPYPAIDDGKYIELGEMLHERTFCCAGDIPAPNSITEVGLLWSRTGDFELTASDDGSPDYWFVICPVCKRAGLTFQARYPRLPCKCSPSEPDRLWNPSIARIITALVAARSERF